MQTPETRYARGGDVNVAYQVLGEGPLDLVFVYGWISHLDFQWTNPVWARFLQRLASFSRLILFDKRGTGLSDPVGAPTFEERMEDVRAVMNAAGSERAAVLGYSEGGTAAALFAATYPQRTTALILYDTWPTGTLDPADNPSGERWLELQRLQKYAIEHWGEGHGLRITAPRAARSAELRRMYGAFERAALSPAMAVAMSEAITHSDIRDVLPAISVPTLVLHFEDSAIPVEGGRYLAERIPGARYVELPGQDHMPLFDDVPEVADEIEEFLTGSRHPREPERVLATVLFTDIVGSTERAAELGDAAWHELLERHDAAVRAELHRYGGREVKHTGDGFLASFEGPARAMRCAVAIGDALREMGLEVRAGVHTGECELADGDLRGLGVHIGARVGALAGPGEVLVSSTVKDLVAGSGIDFEDRGSHGLRGVPGEWRVFAVRATEAAARAPQQSEPIGAFDRLARVMARRAPGVSRLAARTLARRTTSRGTS